MLPRRHRGSNPGSLSSPCSAVPSLSPKTAGVTYQTSARVVPETNTDLPNLLPSIYVPSHWPETTPPRILHDIKMPVIP